mmetsp:Transcript_31542/g.36018  ORF Transcript_31542/g.36018 Transcript_31542/m.36018 type:complete len:158 (+) Transcript_31542:261-734(+)
MQKKAQAAEAEKKLGEIKMRRVQQELEEALQKVREVDKVQVEGRFADEVRDLVECPLSLEVMRSPVVLPSGITIEEAEFDRLKEKGMNDPYDNKLKVKDKISNCTVKKLVDLFNNLKPLEESKDPLKNSTNLKRNLCQNSILTEAPDVMDQKVSLIC